MATTPNSNQSVRGRGRPAWSASVRTEPAYVKLARAESRQEADALPSSTRAPARKQWPSMEGSSSSKSVDGKRLEQTHVGRKHSGSGRNRRIWVEMFTTFLEISLVLAGTSPKHNTILIPRLPTLVDFALTALLEPGRRSKSPNHVSRAASVDVVSRSRSRPTRRCPHAKLRRSHQAEATPAEHGLATARVRCGAAHVASASDHTSKSLWLGRRIHSSSPGGPEARACGPRDLKRKRETPRNAQLQQ